MKQKLLILVFLVAGMAWTTPSAKAQAVEQGDVMLDAYYGFPNLMTGLFRVIANEATSDPNLEVKGAGPFGAKVSYMITDNIGLGLDFFYANSAFKYTDTGIDSSGAAYSYTYQLSNPRPRFLLRADYHFGNSDVVDPYGAIALGYNASRYSFTTDDPDFELINYSTRAIVPVAYRLAFGVKFYFVKFFGATAEIGMGGPLLTVGVSGKF